ncbi:hypothetical protein [Flavobacterium sp. 123]|uniref:hypothetical protein n=1 Tax=Flavobacterium sp. 123 TaxID=2135627 RepID=UPI000EB3E902|nr:hypothetical protein [Flavobacterium sp. 123]RKS98999.1 hypothetical protein C8C88_0763 [Flavobacterium sp. 123]
MGLSVFFTDKFKKDRNVKSFFTIVDSKITIQNKGEEIRLNLNKISNARIIKRRNLIPNILVLVTAFTINFPLLSSYNADNRYNDIFLILIVLAVIASFSIKHYSYRLLINKNNYCFNEFSISKQNLSCAQSFVSMFKTNTTMTQFSNAKERYDYLSKCLA